MLEVAPGWSVHVDRGPDWVFVRLSDAGTDAIDHPPLAEMLWGLLRRHSAHRLVVELDEIGLLRSFLIGQLVLLHKRIHATGGLMRLSGASDQIADVLRTLRLDGRFPPYRTRADAVQGFRPPQPR